MPIHNILTDVRGFRVFCQSEYVDMALYRATINLSIRLDSWEYRESKGNEYGCLKR